MTVRRRQGALVLAGMLVAFAIAFGLGRASQGDASDDTGQAGARPAALSLPAPRAEVAFPGVSLPALRPVRKARARRERDSGGNAPSGSAPRDSSPSEPAPSRPEPSDPGPSIPSPRTPGPSTPAPERSDPPPKPADPPPEDDGPIVGGGT